MPHDVSQTPWRVLRVPWFAGPGDEFTWNGIVWRVQRTIDREGSTSTGGGALTIVVVSPLPEEPGQEPQGVTDFGMVPQGPAIGGPPTSITEAEERQPVTPTATAPAPTGDFDFGPQPADDAEAGFREGDLAAFDEACRNGDLEACQIASVIRQSGAVPGQVGGGLSFEDEIALQELRGQQALAQIRQQLFPQLEATGRQEAQDVTEGITSGLASSLAAIGLAAPQLFLSNAQDPVGLQRALSTALSSGNAVFPTLERQQLIAEAAQSPTDIIRLLFLSGGQTPPKHRPGAFNVVSVIEEGKRAREGLAQEIAALPLPTFEELVDRFTPPLPPIGASKGAVITMKKDGAGVYRAQGGAAVVQGPELFTVGEGGKTEFALLAPGSVIAPKASDDEPETMENARRAVMEMLLFGKRRPAPKAKAAVHGAVVHDDGVPTIGGPTPESGQGLQSLFNLLQGVRGAGASLAKPGRSTTERAQDLKLLQFPFEGVTLQDRIKVLDRFKDDPNIMRFLNIGLTQRARDPLPFATETFNRQEQLLLGQARDELVAEGVDLDAMDEAERNMAIRQRANQNNPEMFGSAEGALAEIEEQRNKGLFFSLSEGGGAPGTALPFAEILNMPAGARAAFITTLGSIFGSDVIADLIDLRAASRTRGFEAGTSRLFF